MQFHCIPCNSVSLPIISWMLADQSLIAPRRELPIPKENRKHWPQALPQEILASGRSCHSWRADARRDRTLSERADPVTRSMEHTSHRKMGVRD